MKSKSELIEAFNKADKAFKETGEDRHRENAKVFADAIRNYEEPKTPDSDRAKLETLDDRLARERRDMATGNNWEIATPFGRVDTGLEMSQGTNEFLAGMGRRVSDIATLGNADRNEKADELLNDSGYATAGGVVADMAALAPVAAPATLGRAAAAGAAYSGATTGGDVKDRAEAATAGALGGAGGYGLTKAASAAINPKLDPRALELERMGVRVTPGRLLGGSASRMEDASTSLPLTGDGILNRQIDSITDYNVAVLDDVLAPLRRQTARSATQAADDVPTVRGGGEVVPSRRPTEVGQRADWIDGEFSRVSDDVAGRTPLEIPRITSAGREGVDKVSEVVSKAYDDVLDQIDSVQLDDTFRRESGRLLQMSEQLDDTAQRIFKRAYDNVMRRFDNETSSALGFNYKRAEGYLRKEYKRQYDRGNKEAGDALRSLFKSMRDAARRQHPELIERLENVDEAYNKLTTVQAAASLKGAREGLFTPDHLLAAIKRKTPDSLYARGRGFDQQAVESAKEVLAKTVPDSGTAGRSILAAASTGFVHPAVPVALAAGGAANSRVGQDAMRAMLLKRPPGSRRLAELLDVLAPQFGRAGTSASINE